MTNATKLELSALLGIPFEDVEEWIELVRRPLAAQVEESCKPGMMIKIDGCNVEIHGSEAQQKACAASIMLALYYASKTDRNLESVCRQWARESDEIMEQIRQLDI